MQTIILLGTIFTIILILKNTTIVKKRFRRWKPILKPEHFSKISSAHDLLSNYYYKGGIQEIGQKFEEYCCWLFEQKGFSAKLVSVNSENACFSLYNMGDGGVDLVVHTDNVDAIVQCKAFGKNKEVNLSLIREFMHVMHMNGKKYGFYITTATFTQPALAEVNQYYHKRGYALYCVDKSLLTRIINGTGSFTDYHPKKWYKIYKKLKDSQLPL